MTGADIKAHVMELGLPEGSYIIIGSALLAALNIRTSDDIDMVVSEAVYDRFHAAGWEAYAVGQKTMLRNGVFDIGTTWENKRLAELADSTTMIDGIRYMNLAELRAWKQNWGRPKDLIDIQLIDAYLHE